ncbi:hypothetical protein P879_10894 [Paragonimus westermani]|uniref:Uncharacterized protein n=1 Tax=Paragonimus westermani TaxID=34504 RepID=A0A8T0D2Q4_9TREM|nr:hypothetical protein P879_10894 [Paragonimus westermani]
MDRTRACLCLLCHYLKLLQACTQWVVTTWSAVTVGDALKFTNAFQMAMNKLDTAELNSLHDFLPTLQPKFQHLSLNVVSSCGLRNSLHTLLHLPEFQPVQGELTDLPRSLLRLIECRLFSSHIRQLDSVGPDLVSVFLDSCYTVDPHRFIDLITATLEQPSSTEGNQFVADHLLSWLYSAIKTDNVV